MIKSSWAVHKFRLGCLKTILDSYLHFLRPTHFDNNIPEEFINIFLFIE